MYASLLLGDVVSMHACPAHTHTVNVKEEKAASNCNSCQLPKCAMLPTKIQT